MQEGYPRMFTGAVAGMFRFSSGPEHRDHVACLMQELAQSPTKPIYLSKANPCYRFIDHRTTLEAHFYTHRDRSIEVATTTEATINGAKVREVRLLPAECSILMRVADVIETVPGSFIPKHAVSDAFSATVVSHAPGLATGAGTTASNAIKHTAKALKIAGAGIAKSTKQHTIPKTDITIPSVGRQRSNGFFQRLAGFCDRTFSNKILVELYALEFFEPRHFGAFGKNEGYIGSGSVSFERLWECLTTSVSDVERGLIADPPAFEMPTFPH